MPDPIPPAPEGITEGDAMRAELPYDVAAALGHVWGEVRCWLTYGEPVLGTESLPPGVLRFPLRALAGRLRALEPAVRERSSPEERETWLRLVAGGCAEISAWAEGMGAVQTALAFAQLAVQAEPDAAAHAYRVGRLARKATDEAGSLEWLFWALRLARESNDRETRARALAGMGALQTVSGLFHRGKRYWRLALRHARAHGSRDLVADALYGLCVVELRKGDLLEGLDHASEALRLLAPTDLRVTGLAREVAVFLLESYGRYEPALLLLDSLRAHTPSEAGQVVLHAWRARAAAGMRLGGLFEEGWSETCMLLGAWRGDPRVAGAAWVQLAHAAAQLGQWRRSLHAASRAVELTAAHPYSEPAHDGRMIRDIVTSAGNRIGRIREEFPYYEAPDAAEPRAEALYDQVVGVLGARSLGERVSPGAEVFTPDRPRTGALLPHG